METTIKLFIMEKGEAENDLENIVKEMNERLVLNEEKLMKTREELLELKTENVQLKEQIKMTEKNLTNKNQDLKREVSSLKNPPFFQACGAYTDYLSITQQTIPYNSLLYSSTNIEGGGLDISSGIFSSPYPGSYTVTWAMMAQHDGGEKQVYIVLRKNGQNIHDSGHYTWYPGSGRGDDQG